MGIIRQVLQCKQTKETEITHTRLTPHQFEKWNCQVFINIKLDKINNNWIMLDPLGNIYEVNANLTEMTLLNLNHF